MINYMCKLIYNIDNIDYVGIYYETFSNPITITTTPVTYSSRC